MRISPAKEKILWSEIFLSIIAYLGRTNFVCLCVYLGGRFAETRANFLFQKVAKFSRSPSASSLVWKIISEGNSADDIITLRSTEPRTTKPIEAVGLIRISFSPFHRVAEQIQMWQLATVGRHRTPDGYKTQEKGRQWPDLENITSGWPLRDDF